MKLDLDRLRSWGVSAFGALTITAFLAMATSEWWNHRVPPWPTGAVLRAELPEERFRFVGPDFRIAALERSGPAIAIHWDAGQPGTSFAHVRETLLIVSYPSGELLECIESPTREQLEEFRTVRAAAARSLFDFDGDGTPDAAKCDGDRAWVESGAGGALLWQQTDQLEYENNERLTPLRDLDGDGCCELAVLHPRQDRSDYDWEPFDLVFGVRSWLTVVSGAKATRR